MCNRLSSIKAAMPATLAFDHVPSEGSVMDNPGFESLGDQMVLPRIFKIK